MLSDPGNYRIGRKISVNNHYSDTLEARYRDYHADTINAILDEEASSFDTLFSYLDEETGDIMALYDYLNGLATGSSNDCASSSEPSSADTDESASFWQVSYVEGKEDGYGTYTLATSCLEIEVPRIPCDFSPCTDLWKTTSSGSDYKEDLIDAYGGYYDFESMLLTDENKEEYGENLYDYFYDKYGERKYPTNGNYMEAKIFIDAGEYDWNDHPNYIGANILIEITHDGITQISYSNNLEDESDTTNGDNDIAEDYLLFEPDYQFAGDYHPFNTDEDKNYTNTEGDFLHRKCSTYDGCSFYFSGYELANSIGAYFNYTYSSLGYEFSVSSKENDIYTITISINIDEHPELDNTDIQLSFSTSNTNLEQHISIENFQVLGQEKPFQYGDGAFNAMITHMVMEPLNGTDEDAYDYDCYDLYLIWEEIVNSYADLFDPDLGTGTDLLEYFLQKAGKQYGGFADHEYGKGDENDFLNDGLSSSSNDYGYGYLEYAYKSYYLNYNSITDGSTEIQERIGNCTENYGISLENPIDKWTNPDETYDADLNLDGDDDDEGEQDIAIWNDSCGTHAWYDATVIPDDHAESSHCRAWQGLYECLNSDLELYAGDISSEIGTACTNTPDANCTQAYSNYIYDETLAKISTRGLDFSTVFKHSFDGISREKANNYSYSLVGELEDELESLIKDAYGNASFSSYEQLAMFRKIHNHGIEVADNASGLGGIVSASSIKHINAKIETKSQIMANELSRKFRKSESLTLSEINAFINKICTKYGWENTKTSLSNKFALPSALSSTTQFSLHASATKFSFESINGKLIISNLSSGSSSSFSGVFYEELFDMGTDDETVVFEDFYFAWGDGIKAIDATLEETNSDCDERNLSYLSNQIQYSIDEAKSCRLENSLAEYDAKCTVPSEIDDSLIVSYTIDYHQYTLFFYDLNGNLIKTIPPKGVDVFERDSDNDGVNDATPSRQDEKDHQLATIYKYNSFGQRVYEGTPDGGEKYFWYNSIGQLRFSQNALQKSEGKYAYVKYDVLGRINEAGYSEQSATDNAFTDEVDNSDFPSEKCKEKIITVFTEDFPYGINESQQYIQNRVSYAYTDPDGNDANGDEAYTIYSYDPHGNVEWMADSIPGLDMKYIYYEYDLITAKVTKVKYNEGKVDQFFHRYSYDSDNRIKTVETSGNGILWDKDATYEYYAYGPLKRLSIGQDNVQGLDYVYTINGWLKAMNHQSLSSTYDPANDGDVSIGNFATDAFGMTLGYFNGDFKRGIDDNNDGTLDQFSAFNSEFNTSSSQYFNTGVMQLGWNYDTENRNVAGYDVNNTAAVNYRPLFNGTITNMAYNTQQSSGSSLAYDGKVKGEYYNYDELYRLTASNFDYFDGTENKWARAPLASVDDLKDYKTSYTYDLNGNITTLQRFGYSKSGNLGMDVLYYVYNNETNQLNSINDLINSGNYDTDLDDQNTDNYTYNAIGQLTKDEAAGISKIEWALNGKVSEVTKSDGTTISFTYDALGNKISKTETGTLGISSSTTYYIRDAKGNEMGIYKEKAQTSTNLSFLSGNGSSSSSSEKTVQSLTLTEVPLYAAGGRLGMFKSEEGIDVSTNEAAADTGTYTRETGSKYYELKDHLGNMRAVVTDAKQADINAGTASPENFTANVASLADYYPYGMEMPGQTYSSDDYRYGYQGKEKETEMYGNANGYDFGARILDPRVGRWLSMDPLKDTFPSESPYNAMGNNPVNMVDPDGRSAVESVDFAKHTITVSATVNIHGEGATEEVRDVMQYQINAAYRINTFKDPLTGDTWTVRYDIQVKIVDKSEVPVFLSLVPWTENYIEISKDPEHRSFVSLNGRTGTWAYDGKGYGGVSQRDRGRNPTAHEVGHLLGIGDRYSDQRLPNGKKTSQPDPGWTNTMMSALGKPFTDREAYLAVKDGFEIAKKLHQMQSNVPINVDGGWR
jgi:RHS repeat-associated protein